MSMKSYTYQLHDVMKFGKFKGLLIQSIIDQNPWYIKWCVSKLANFLISDESWDYACQRDAEFVAMRPQKESTVTIHYQQAGAEEKAPLVDDEVEVLYFYPFHDLKKARERFFERMKREAVDVHWEEIPIVQPVQLALW